VLFLDDSFDTLDGWEFDLNGDTASLELVEYEAADDSRKVGVASASSTYVASRVSYCGSACYRAEMKVASDLRSSVIPSNSGEYWMGFRLRIPTGWVWGGETPGVTDFTYIMQLRGGDNTGGSPIFGLRSIGDKFKMNFCGRLGSSRSTECSYVTLNDVPLVGGEWMDWVIKLDMQHASRTGSVRVWVNEVLVYSLDDQVTSFDDVNAHYLKLGTMQQNWKSGDELSNSWTG
jgi:hypothetical protein